MDNIDNYANGAADLLVEAKLLNAIKHPHIIELHSMSTEGIDGFQYHRGYFLILDRLSCTLDC